MSVPFVRSPYNYDAMQASDESGLRCEDESLAQQSFADECDINTIVRRFGLTGQLPQDLQMPVSGDFSGISDYHTAMNMVIAAQDEFLRVPPHVRARFDNDPGALMAFLDDVANRDEAVQLGLIPAAPAAPIASVASVPSGGVSSPSSSPSSSSSSS